MSRQIAIAGTREDLAELADHASEWGARAVPSEIPLDDPPELHDPRELLDEDPERQIYLLPDDLAAVEIMAIEAFDDPEAGRVNDRTSPVVQLVPSRVEGDAISSGRLYLGVERSHPLHASATRLYDALVRFTKPWTTTEGEQVRVGPRAAEQARSGSMRVTSSGGASLTLKGESS